MKRLHNIKIKENSWLALIAAKKLGITQVALTIGQTIHLHSTSRQDFLADDRWVKHELAHVEQFRRHGFVRFLGMYLWESVKNGYYENRFEVEARYKEAT